MRRKRRSSDDQEPPSISGDRYETEVKPQLDALPNNAAKVSYLKRLIFEIELEEGGDSFKVFLQWDDFYNKCQEALKEYEPLARIETEKEKLSAILEAAPRNPEFTTARQVWMICYLLQAAGVGLDVRGRTARVTDLIVFLTGKNKQNVRETVADFIAGTAGRKTDLEYILPAFKEFGLEEIVERIKKELQM